LRAISGFNKGCLFELVINGGNYAVADSGCFEQCRRSMTTVSGTSPQQIDDRVARRNALVLAVAQAFYGMAAVNIIITAGLVGTQIAPSLSLATLPVSTFVIGTALSTIPASMFMRRVGRRAGFLTGAAFGLAGALVCVWAVFAQDFWLFSFGTFLQGGYQAFAGYYRFAAADTASASFKPKAISWVMIGGIAAATLGPMLVIVSRDYFAPVMFAGNFAAIAALSIVAMAVLAFVDIPHTREDTSTSDARPLGVILRQPKLLVAILCGMMAYGMMNLVMTATPIAMVACGFTVDDSAWVIQWHALAMYIPSFFTGSLIARFGVEKVLAAGMALLAMAGAFGLAGIDYANFAIGLILLGIGWNFGYIGGTALVTECYRPSEKNKVQAVNDFCVFATVATASLTSGKLLAAIGWSAVNVAVFPMVGLCLAAIGWLMLHDKRSRLVK
jgi:predicted MFS family arabinose efflux permease